MNRIYIVIAVVFAAALSLADTKDMFFNIIGVLWLDTLIAGRKIRFDMGDALVVLSTLSFRVINNPDPGSVITGTLKMLALYQVARYFADPDGGASAEKNGGDVSDRVIFIVILAAFALFLRGILNYSYYLTDSAFLSKGEWPVWNPRWSSFYFDDLEEVVIPADEHQFYPIMMGSLLPYFLMHIRKKKLLCILGVILSVTAIWLGTLSSGGLGFVCCLVAIFAALIVIAAEKGMLASLGFWVKAGAVIDILAAFIISVKLNLFGIGSWYSANIWSQADSGFYRMRFSLMGQALSFIPQYPFGGFDMRLVIPNVRTEYFAYNSWLDMAVHAGIIPLILALVLLGASTAMVISAARSGSGAGKIVLTAAFFGITAYHMLEPAFLKDARYWNTWIFLAGIAWGMRGAITGRRGMEILFDGARWRMVRKGHDKEADQH